MRIKSERVGIIVPTYNPGPAWNAWLRGFDMQRFAVGFRLVIDSTSDDGYVDKALASLFEIVTISKSDFNHGGTRQAALALLAEKIDVVIFMTQDALFFDAESIENLVEAFNEDEDIAAVYGRQLPHSNSGPVGAHARFFNYPAESIVKSAASKSTLGFKTIFISNSFAAYRVKDLLAVGGFSSRLILGEDTVAAAKLVLCGKKIAYRADACVFHSHDYSYGEEFRRYFDIGVLHAREPWLSKEFGGVGGEGARFLRSEISHLSKHAWHLIPSAFIRTGFKYIGYKMGRQEGILPVSVKRLLSMHRGFWKDEQ